MPRYMTGSAEGDRALAAQESAQEGWTEAGKLTELLCSICRTFDSYNYNWATAQFLGNKIEMPKAVADWWEKNKKVDQVKENLAKKRQQDELDKKEALALLTPRQRQLLGL